MNMIFRKLTVHLTVQSCGGEEAGMQDDMYDSFVKN